MWLFWISKCQKPVMVHVHIPALLQIVDVDRPRFGIQYLLQEVLALFQRALHPLALGDLGKEDSESVW